jgi:hypothetical protein
MEELWEKFKNIFVNKDKSLNWGAIAIGAGTTLAGGLLGNWIGSGSFLAVALGAVAALVGGAALAGQVFKDKLATDSNPKSKVLPSKTVKVSINGEEQDLHIPAEPVAPLLVEQVQSIGPDGKLSVPHLETATDFIGRQALRQGQLSNETAFNGEIPKDLENVIRENNQRYNDYVVNAYALAAKNNKAGMPKIEEVQFPSDLRDVVANRDGMTLEKWNTLTSGEKLEHADRVVTGRLHDLTVSIMGSSRKQISEMNQEEREATNTHFKAALKDTESLSGVAMLVPRLAINSVKGIAGWASTNLEDAQELADKYLAGKLGESDFKAQMQELAKSQRASETNGKEGAALIESWTKDIVALKPEIVRYGQVGELKIKGLENAKKYYSDVDNLHKEKVISATTRSDSTSLENALAGHTDLVSRMLPTDGRHYDQTDLGGSANVAKANTPTPANKSVATNPRGEISTSGIGSGNDLTA